MAYELKTDSGMIFNFTREDIQPFDGEWYRLAEDKQAHQMGHIQLSSPFQSAGTTIHLAFDFINWGGDALFNGWAIYLFDASAPGAGTGGANGGEMGYIELKGAYVGIGIDSFGVFNHWVRTGQRLMPLLKNNVTVRGSQARDYAREGAFALKKPLSYPSTTRQEAMDFGALNHVEVTWVPHHDRPGYSIDLSINRETVFKKLDYPYAAPSSMKIGVSTTTGTGRVNQEFRNLQVSFSKQPRNLALGAEGKVFIGASHIPIPAPYLTDGDKIHKDWSGSGSWTGKLGTHGQKSGYVIDFAPNTIELNSVTVYFFQGDKSQVEPSDTTLFTYDGATEFELRFFDGANWVSVAQVTHNLLAKKTFNFPTQRVFALDVRVFYTNGKHADQRMYPVVTEIEAFKL